MASSTRKLFLWLCSIANIAVDATPGGLKRLDIIRQSGYEDLPIELAASLRSLTSDLEYVVLKKIVDPVLCFAPYECHNFSAVADMVPSWQALRKLKVVGPGEWLTSSALRDKVEKLLVSAGRAITFMPNLEILFAVTGFKFRLSGPREDVAFEFEQIPGRLAQAGNLDTCFLSVPGHLPSRQAANTWKDSVDQARRVVLDVKVKLDLGEEDSLPWEDAMEEQASASPEHLGEYCSEP